MKTLLVISTLILTGCASLQTQWQGKDVNALIDKMGLPNKQMEIDGSEIWEYVSSCSGSSYTSAPHNVLITSNFSQCTHRVFRIKQGKIVSAKKRFK